MLIAKPVKLKDEEDADENWEVPFQLKVKAEFAVRVWEKRSHAVSEGAVDN